MHRQTDLAAASPHPTVLLDRAGSASEICTSHEVSWGGEGLPTPLCSYRPAPFITPADSLDLCTWEKKGKATKTPPHTEQPAVRIKDYCITFLCCIQGFFGLSSLPDLIYHDYPPSSVSELISSWELNSQNYSYTCTLKKLNMHTLSK